MQHTPLWRSKFRILGIKKTRTKIGTLRISHTSSKLHRDIPPGASQRPTWGKWGILLTRFGDWVEHTSVAQVEVSRGLLLFVSVSCLAFIFKFVHDLLITIQCFHPFSKHAISMSASISEFQKTCLQKFSALVMFLDISSTILWRCNLKSPQNGNLKTRIIHIDRFIYLLCLKCVLIKATCEREIIKLF